MGDGGAVEAGGRVELRRSVPQEWCRREWGGRGRALRREVKYIVVAARWALCGGERWEGVEGVGVYMWYTDPLLQKVGKKGLTTGLGGAKRFRFLVCVIHVCLMS